MRSPSLSTMFIWASVACPTRSWTALAVRSSASAMVAPSRMAATANRKSVSESELPRNSAYRSSGSWARRARMCRTRKSGTKPFSMKLHFSKTSGGSPERSSGSPTVPFRSPASTHPERRDERVERRSVSYQMGRSSARRAGRPSLYQTTPYPSALIVPESSSRGAQLCS